MSTRDRGSVRLVGTAVGTKRIGAYVQLTVVAPEVADRFRPGTGASVRIGGPPSEHLLRRTLPIHRARPTGAYGGTVEMVFEVALDTEWLAALADGSRVDMVGPVGRPFALPKEPVTCTLVGYEAAAAALSSLAELLTKRGCSVHMLLGAANESRLWGTLEARRAARSVVVTTDDGSVGMRGGVGDVLPDLLSRTSTEVVYAAGPSAVLHEVAALAEQAGAWSQTAVSADCPCGTGLCLGCMVPVVGEDGIARDVRACVEGPVFRGDRVRWDELRGREGSAR